MRIRTFAEREGEEDPKMRKVYACCPGEIISLEKLSNDVFSSMILGEGFGVLPSGGEFTAPADGVVKDISSSGSDVTIKTDDDLTLIVSVRPNAPDIGFSCECLVCPNDRVTRSSVIWNIADHKNVTAAVIVTNGPENSQYSIRCGKLRSLDQPVMTF